MTTKSKNTPLALIILDGLGNNPNEKANAFHHASTPTLDKLRTSCPYTELITHGERVGLPDGQMGNSEVGHLNIGGGRVVEQELTRINRHVSNGTLGKLPPLIKLFETVKNKNTSSLHLIGLVSYGGVHSYIKHLEALIKEATKQGVRRIYIHAITDGRDRPPQEGKTEVSQLVNFIDNLKTNSQESLEIEIISIIGRYFAMDRDSRWERTKKAYDLFTLGTGEQYSNVASAIESRYNSGFRDEFLEPLSLECKEKKRKYLIQDGDAILFFNFRADRMRQIVSAFCTPTFDMFTRESIPELSAVCTLTEYEPHYEVDVLYQHQDIKNHLGTVISNSHLRQLRIAETEKYPHVTYFFNGGVEQRCVAESRILTPSPRDVPTYDKKPEMSAYGITKALLDKLNSNEIDVIIANFANCDMVGHTGNFEAAVKAVETVDTCLAQVLSAIEAQNGVAIVTADHGNAEQMIDYDTGEPHTFHTTYPVPFFLVGASVSNIQLRSGGSLCDIAPTICELLQIPLPIDMSGKSLIC